MTCERSSRRSASRSSTTPSVLGDYASAAERAATRRRLRPSRRPSASSCCSRRRSRSWRLGDHRRSWRCRRPSRVAWSPRGSTAARSPLASVAGHARRARRRRAPEPWRLLGRCQPSCAPGGPGVRRATGHARAAGAARRRSWSRRSRPPRRSSCPAIVFGDIAGQEIVHPMAVVIVGGAGHLGRSSTCSSLPGALPALRPQAGADSTLVTSAVAVRRTRGRVATAGSRRRLRREEDDDAARTRSRPWLVALGAGRRARRRVRARPATQEAPAERSHADRGQRAELGAVTLPRRPSGSGSSSRRGAQRPRRGAGSRTRPCSTTPRARPGRSSTIGTSTFVRAADHRRPHRG